MEELGLTDFWQAWVSSHPVTSLTPPHSGSTSSTVQSWDHTIYFLKLRLFLFIEPGGSCKPGKGSATVLHPTGHPTCLVVGGAEYYKGEGRL